MIALTTVHADQTFRIVGNNGNQGFYVSKSSSSAHNNGAAAGDSKLEDVSHVSEFSQNPIMNVMVGEKIIFVIEAIMLIYHPKTNESRPYAFGLTTSFLDGAMDFSSDTMGNLVASSSCTRAHNGPAYYTTNISDPCILTWTVVEPGWGNHFYYTTNQTLIKMDAIVQQVQQQSLQFRDPKQPPQFELLPLGDQQHHQHQHLLRARGRPPSPSPSPSHDFIPSDRTKQVQHERTTEEEEMAWRIT